MNNAEYIVFEKPFQEAARPLMNQLRTRLVEMGYGPFSEVYIVDHDISRGLGFVMNTEADVDQLHSVELMLNDGCESGFEGVGLVLDCSMYSSGQIWAPGNYTENVGMTEPQEVIDRLNNQFNVSIIAEEIGVEWQRISAQ